MTDYTKTTDFAAKDSLPSGDSGKIIRGAEFETEFDNISTSIATKADLASPTFTGTATIPTAAVTSLTLNGVEINYLDVTTLGEIEASKVVTANSSGDVLFGDDKKALFGTGSDLKIYHDGSNSYIEDAGGTGSLFIRSDPELKLQTFNGTENYFTATHSGSVNLYWANLLRLSTSNAGVDITGKLSATSLELNNVDVTSNGTELQLSATKTSTTDSILKIKDTSATDVLGDFINLTFEGSSGELTGGRIGLTQPAPSAPRLFISSNSVGLNFYEYISTNAISPCDDYGAYRDNVIDLGQSSARFDDIYATNSTIQTSDVNEKQDIDVLSDAEQRVAVAAKGLLKKFRWRSAVEEKGDEARIHFGIIAQDLQAAFEAEGLDAGRYAMFINDTWTDPDTNEERSRMGVRYSELLAFIISAI